MEQQNNKEHLHILWTNADVTTAKLMVERGNGHCMGCYRKITGRK